MIPLKALFALKKWLYEKYKINFRRHNVLNKQLQLQQIVQYLTN